MARQQAVNSLLTRPVDFAHMIETKQIYESFADAARKTGLNRTKIVSVCTGTRKSTGGLHFRYADTE